LVAMLHKERELVSTQVESVASTAKIRGGEVQHTGVVPFLKKFEATVRCCTQNGIRGGSATVHFPIWHQEIEDILSLEK
jgi:ribonucleoside-diphosphate reductase alpha chain